MKKLFLAAFLAIGTFVSIHAQKDVTTFMGIPVDGTEQSMIQKLQRSGFEYDYRTKTFNGEFNGRDAMLKIATNKQRVWRICIVYDFGEDNEQTKIVFNNLCKNFENSPKYTSASGSNKFIPAHENISDEILYRNKSYTASYYQNPKDTAVINQQLREYLLEKYPELQHNPTEEMKAYITMDTIEYMSELYAKKSVWLKIQKDILGYFIVIYYDNEYNHVNGEDL